MVVVMDMPVTIEFYCASSVELFSEALADVKRVVEEFRKQGRDIRLLVLPIEQIENFESAKRYLAEKKGVKEVERVVTPLIVVNGKVIYVGYREDLADELRKALK